MKIEPKEIAVRDIYEGYKNDVEEGVVGYGGKLNIRPRYQREFVYNDKQRDEVIKTLRKDFPLNVMYWVTDKNPFELLDGQQRTISICEYIDGNFSVDGVFFHNLTKDKQEQILNYKLMIYFCEGEDSEKLDWFEIVNIAGEKLTVQERRNAIYSGEWLEDAKKYFSKTGCPVYNIAGDYLTGVAIRQDYLEIFLKWISNNDIEGYMGKNQHKPDASELWMYFNSVMSWVKTMFPDYRKEMKGVNWGELYNEYKDNSYSVNDIKKEVEELMMDDDVDNKKGIYRYIFTRKEKYLNIRSFTQKQRREVYEKQKGVCPQCRSDKKYKFEAMEADHITPWSCGGKTTTENCQMLCKEHNRLKSNV
jgi:hypothetical protein